MSTNKLIGTPRLILRETPDGLLQTIPERMNKNTKEYLEQCLK